jgi:hypothetical protein
MVVKDLFSNDDGFIQAKWKKNNAEQSVWMTH